MSTTQPSGWCSPCCSPRAHAICEDRVNRGLLSCTCPDHPVKPAPTPTPRKPLTGTVAGNVLAHGTGALNIDGCRVGETVETWPATRSFTGGISAGYTDGVAKGPTQATGAAPAGRWPANVVLDESQAAALDRQSGESASRAGGYSGTHFSAGDPGVPTPDRERGGHDDSGGASRFFYTAKADAAERVRLPAAGGTSPNAANRRCATCKRSEITGTRCECAEPQWERETPGHISHPTVKPLALMRWLVRLVTPPGGTVLEPFAGSGTTVEACILEGFRCIAIEREADYLPLILQRIHRRRDPVAAVLATGEDGGLFDLLGEEPA